MPDILFFTEFSTLLEHGREALEVLDHHRDRLIIECSHLASFTIAVN